MACARERDWFAAALFDGTGIHCHWCAATPTDATDSTASYDTTATAATAAAAMEECCFICAEPLEWLAYGPCGHKEACSKCVMRMRFVLKDTRCVMCQQEAPAVLVTRALGSFTASAPPEVFSSLSHKNSREKGYHCLRSIDAYFDDQDHFQHMRRMCSFSHPAASSTDGANRTFPNLKELKKHLLSVENLHFCDLCVENRKVFISEQQLYTKADLNRHLNRGDASGPMAENIFKAIPSAVLASLTSSSAIVVMANVRFCRKRFYGENEIYQHMQTAHEHCFICRRADPNKYVYYRDYTELEGHFRSSHFLCEDSDCLANKFVVFPSEQELRQHKALEHKGGMSKGQRREALALPTAFQYPEGAGPPGARSRRNANAGGAAGRGAQEMSDSDVHIPISAAEVQFSPDDFPVAGGSAGAAAHAGGGGTSRWASAASSSQGGGALTQEDFPALPATSKSQRRRAKQRATTASRPSAGAPAAPQMAHSTSAPNLQHAPPSAAAAASAAHGWREPPSDAAPPPAPESWPSLGAENAVPVTPSSTGYSSVASSRPAGGALSNWGRMPDAPPISTSNAFDPGSAEAFPSLPASGPAQPLRRTARPAPAPSRGPAAPRTPAQASGSQAPQSTVSQGVREANQLLVQKIQQRVDADAFAAFKRESGKFMRHEIDAGAYFHKIAELGLVSLTAELASLCPEPQRRAELLDVYRTQSAVSTWVPPEVVEAATQQAQANATWRCSICTLINAPSSESCESCGAPRALQLQDVVDDIENELSVSKKKKGKAKANTGSGAGQSAGPSGGPVARGAWGGGQGAQLTRRIAGVESAWSRR
eukprot:jgi/Tetstr1/460983/TSEL_006135.t1